MSAHSANTFVTQTDLLVWAFSYIKMFHNFVIWYMDELALYIQDEEAWLFIYYNLVHTHSFPNCPNNFYYIVAEGIPSDFHAVFQTDLLPRTERLKF